MKRDWGSKRVVQKREVVFDFGNSSTGGITGTMGDGDEFAGRVSSVPGGWGLFICRFPWLDKFSSSLILPCSDETRGLVNTLPCSDKTTVYSKYLLAPTRLGIPIEEDWTGGMNLMLGALGSGLLVLEAIFFPGCSWMTGVVRLLRPGALGARWELGWFWIWFWWLEEDWTAMTFHPVMMMHQSPPPLAWIPDLVVTFTWRHTGKFVGNGSAMQIVPIRDLV